MADASDETPLFLRGPQDAPLPQNAVVQRACKLPLDYESGRPLSRAVFDFSLSSRDKLQPVPKLSVYVQGMTTEEQICALVGDGQSHRVVAYLPVDGIRAIEDTGHRLDAVWDEAVMDNGEPDERPGAEGHAGIIGLQRPISVDRAIFKRLQTALGDLVGSYAILP